MQNNQERILELNKKLVGHLQANGIQNAVVYAPHNPAEYWKPGNVRIAFCNEEPYSTDGNFEQGIKTIDGDTLDAWSDGNRTIKTEFDINYCIRHALKTGKTLTEQDIVQLKEQTKPNAKDYYNKYEEMDKSLYFNFRYSIPTDTASAHTGYIQKAYENDSFYAQHYKEFLQAADPKVLVLGSEFGAKLFTLIFPELQGKLVYCGEPMTLNGRVVISIPHPSRISNAQIADVVNKISKTLG